MVTSLIWQEVVLSTGFNLKSASKRCFEHTLEAIKIFRFTSYVN